MSSVLGPFRDPKRLVKRFEELDVCGRNEIIEPTQEN